MRVIGLIEENKLPEKKQSNVEEQKKESNNKKTK